MSKESHGWEFFKSMFTNEEPDLFQLKEFEKMSIGDGMWTQTETYHDVFVSSTDYETATDYMHHQVAGIIGNLWMTKCGIPKVLRSVVCNTCYKPRTIRFGATGPLAELGSPTETEGIRMVMSTRGVLMGDPLTKVCLHLLNVVAREIAMNGRDPTFTARNLGYFRTGSRQDSKEG